MKVAVTGASGFLGSLVARELLRAGHEVRVLARDPRRLGELERTGIEIVKGDITAAETVLQAMDGAQAVVHCAGLVSLNLADRRKLEEVNVEGTRHVLEGALARGLRVVHTSTIATVGPTRGPIALDEQSAPVPLAFDYPYAKTKRQAEALAFEYHRRGLDVVVVNPGILFGPGDVNFTSTQFVLRYLRREVWMHLPGGASFGDARDVAAAYPAALVRGRSGQRYLLAGLNRTYAELQEELRRLAGLHRSMPLPPAAAEWLALWSQASSGLFRHPFVEFNTSVVRWASLFNFTSSRKAEIELGYRPRPFSATLADTIVDHLRRGAAPASTPELKALLNREPRQAPGPVVPPSGGGTNPETRPAA